MDPGMFEDKSGPEAHDRAHKGNGYTGPYGSDQQGIIFSRNRHFKSDFRSQTVNEEKPHDKADGKHKTHF